MNSSTLYLTLAVALGLSACGGGTTTSPEPTARPEPELPLEPFDTVRVSLERETGNPTAAEVLAYLETHANGSPWYDGPDRRWRRDPGLSRFDRAMIIAGCVTGSYDLACGPGVFMPEVRMAEGTTAEQRELVLYSIAMVNRWLPYYEHILVTDRDYPEWAVPSLERIENIPTGKIFVDFADTGGGGSTELDALEHDGSLRAARVRVSWDRLHSDAERRFVLMHEFLHALGMAGHVRNEDHLDSIMRDNRTGTSWLHTDYIPSIDGEALRILYTHLNAEAIEPDDLFMDSLGPWEQEALNLAGEIGALSFGVRHRNGVSVPWTAGPEPVTSLADNQALQGTVTWEGGLLGFTPDQRPVGGNAEISVDLAVMSGVAAFTDLQSWPDGRRECWELAFSGTPEVSSTRLRSAETISAEVIYAAWKATLEA